MDNRVQKFIDIMVSNYQPEPDRFMRSVAWWNDKNQSVMVLFNNEEDYYTDHKKYGTLKFDGTAESIPEELTDMIFKTNGFTEDKKCLHS